MRVTIDIKAERGQVNSTILFNPATAALSEEGLNVSRIFAKGLSEFREFYTNLAVERQKVSEVVEPAVAPVVEATEPVVAPVVPEAPVAPEAPAEAPAEETVENKEAAPVTPEEPKGKSSKSKFNGFGQVSA